MPQLVYSFFSPDRKPSRRLAAHPHPDPPLEARVKRDCTEIYPGVDPRIWYRVVLNGEFTDDLEGFWIQVDDRVTYVLARHFDLQAHLPLH